MNLSPLGTRVLILIDEEEEEQEGSIIIPGRKNSLIKGLVLSEGPQTETPFKLAGKKVLLPREISDRSVIDREKREVLVEEKEILGVLVEADPK